MPRQSMQQDTAELERIEPGRNAFRFYRAALWPDLFGRITLMREWGRIGQDGQLKLDSYDDHPQAEAALDKLVRRKKRKGYREA